MRFEGTEGLIYLDGDSLLVVGGGGEDLGFFGGDDGVTGDQFSHHTSDGLDSESQGAHIEQNDVHVVFSGKNSSLNICINTLSGVYK